MAVFWYDTAMDNQLLETAFKWVEHPSGESVLSADVYCSTRDIFMARLDKIRGELQDEQFLHVPLFIAIIGEIGNNAYDHNLGSWRSIPGVYFGFDAAEKIAVIADRGQGVRKTLSRVRPELKSDAEALEVAFTMQISGRDPERRGNGLKFVRDVIQRQKWSMTFYSGVGKAIIQNGGEIKFSGGTLDMKGCICCISI